MAVSTKYSCGRCLGLSILLVTLLGGPAEGAVTLAWDPNPESDIAGYIISYGMSSRQYTTRIDVGNTTRWVFSQPDPTKVYFLAVQAYNTAGLESRLLQRSVDHARHPASHCNQPHIQRARTALCGHHHHVRGHRNGWRGPLRVQVVGVRRFDVNHWTELVNEQHLRVDANPGKELRRDSLGA